MSKQLFGHSEQEVERQYPYLPKTTVKGVGLVETLESRQPNLDPSVDDLMLEVFSHAEDPTDPIELRDLWIGRVEYELSKNYFRPHLAEKWRTSFKRRSVSASALLRSRTTVRFTKELFNWFFRDELYGELRSDLHIILSSGAVDEVEWGLPSVLKDCIHYALDRDWYGYSDPRGRVAAREAIAVYENLRIAGAPYDESNVALTMGGTFAISTVVDLILQQMPHARRSPALCAIPNYPPLVESVARRSEIELIPTMCSEGFTHLSSIIQALTPTTPLVLLQTTTNPTGSAVDEKELEHLVKAASPSTMIVLDECHDWLGPFQKRSYLRSARNVIRITSLSKTLSVPGLKIGWILADSEFIAEYYEYASTIFGGPPSFFFTAIELFARMESWILREIEEPSSLELQEFESSYQLDLKNLVQTFKRYRRERTRREQSLQENREAAIVAFAKAGAEVIVPRYSINMAMILPGWNDSYKCFRDLLESTNVALFPGILTFCYSGAVMRVTTARNWVDLSTAAARIAERLSE